MLCCALLITVASLFTGFIRSVEDSVGDYLGDVILSAPGTFKIEEYADFQQQLVGLSVVKAATPVLSGNGLLLTGPGQIRAAQILGIDLKNQLRVSPLKDALIRQKNLPDEQVAFGEFADKAEIGGFVGIGLIDDPDEMTDSYDMPTVESFIGRKAAVTTGTLVEQVPAESDPAAETAGPRFTRKVLRFTIADVVQTGVYEFDQAFVYVPIEALSSLLYPDRKPCCESFQIALEPGADEEKAMAMIRGLWLVYAQDRYPWAQQVEIQSSRQMQALLIAEYHKQLNMLMLIFGIVSFGVVLLVFCIFYLIVMTRQKDIAIVKSCGASSLSVAGMYLLFGLVNGVLGSLLGAGLGWLITRNIEIIEKGITAMTGLKIWKASTYLFTKIPNEVNWQWAFWICIAALAAAAVGALIPAVAAARIRPVRLLRYE
jgi:lipoprotein-releasing system permease protein